MKKFFLLFILTLILPFQSKASDAVKKQIKADLVQQFKVGTYQMGKKYIVAMPPNETETFPLHDSAIEIYVAAPKQTNLDITINGKVTNKLIKAGDVLVIDKNMGFLKEEVEIRIPNTANDKTITIEADNPVSVYVLNSKSPTSDGYMAIPVDHWKTEYIHCSYYDNHESSHQPFAGGFIVLGSEDATSVAVELNGVGKDVGFIKNTQKTIGDEIFFSINEGEAYSIETDGKTKGQFDISGSMISSDKPIGVISYHMRTPIPILASTSRDHLCEMIPPTSSLGKNYASIALQRGGSKKGDLFRIVASEDNTNFSAKWYDLETKSLIGEKPGLLKKAGDFEEISSTKEVEVDNQSITGASVFTADKPVLIMQYSYSSIWDDSQYDPFMWVVTPIDQFVTHALVQSPYNKSFAENYINIIASSAPADTSKTGLKSIKIDKKNLTELVPDFTTNHIQGTNLYWARLPIAPGAHSITGNGEVKFGAYIYGFKSVDSYGWPAALASKPLEELDTLEPLITYLNDNMNSGEWKVRVQENRVYENGEHTPKDSKVWFEPITMIENDYGLSSTNFKQPQIDFQWQYGAHDDYEVKLEVENMNLEAEANFYVVDYAGNITLENIKYFPNRMVLNNEEDIDFGSIAVNSTKTKTLSFVNNSKVDFEIKSVEIEGASAFSIVNSTLPVTVKKGETISIEVAYNPEIASELDQATIRLYTENITNEYTVSGRAFSDEEILVFEGSSVLDFGTVTVDESEEMPANILNNGDVDIEILSIDLKDGTIFTLNNTHGTSVLETAQSLSVMISYSPVIQSELDTDTLIVKTAKTEYTYPMIGKAKVGDGIIEATDNLIKISPNPLQSEATIALNVPNATQLKAKLFGSEGQLVKVLFEGICNKGEKALKLDASALASGSYTLVIEFDNQKVAKQILIAK